MRSLLDLLLRTDRRLFLSGFIVVLLAVVSLTWKDTPVQELQVDSSWSEPAARRSALFGLQEPTPDPVVDATPTPTPLPPELQTNYQQTTGVIIFAGVVVLVIVAGVFNELIKERRTRI